jgi:serine/threonine protein kinase
MFWRGPGLDSSRTILLSNTMRLDFPTPAWQEEQGIRKPFSQVEDKEITPEDRAFLCDIMQMDHRDRPTAKALLKHDWFDGL